ncbi:MAG: hypothetical protein SCK28_01655 [Bacillota bacterium]|nr:hypothetical protein [Bacillota bacterium]
MKITSIICPILIAISLMFDLGVSDAQEPLNQRALVIIFDGLEWDDIETYQLENTMKIINQGGIGLLNTVSSGPRTRPNTLFTMISGSPTAAPKNGSFIYQRDEAMLGQRAGVFFEEITGYQLDRNVELVHLGATALLNNNLANYGNLGDILINHGLTAKLFTSYDYSSIENRQLANILINSKGYSPDTFKQLTITEANLVKGLDYHYLNEIILQDGSNEQLQIIEIADLAKLDQLKEFLLPNRYYAMREELLLNFDNWIGLLINSLDPYQDLLLIVNPAPSEKNLLARNFLTPIIMWGKGIENSLLISSTTKRAGIVVNYDILPTIIRHFNISENHGVGANIYSSDVTSNVSSLMKLQERLQVVYLERPAIIKSYIFTQIIIIPLALLTIIRSWPVKKLISLGLMFLTIVPFSLLVTAPLNVSFWHIIIANISVIGIVLAISFTLEARKKMAGILFIACITSVALAVDLLNDSYLIKQSLLGYDPIAGARYYGIGNEYMGVFIGSSMITFSLGHQFVKSHFHLFLKALILIGSIMVIALIGLPQLGTNVGGTIAAALGFSYLIYRIVAERINKALFFVAAPALVMTILALLVITDLNRSIEAQSHIGKTALLIREEGIMHLIDIANRKVSMNIKLIRYTYWSRVFLVLLGSIVFFVYKPPGLLANELAHNPGLKLGIASISLASLVALLVNDSGIVAAATMMVYGAIPVTFALINSEYS